MAFDKFKRNMAKKRERNFRYSSGAGDRGDLAPMEGFRSPYANDDLETIEGNPTFRRRMESLESEKSPAKPAQKGFGLKKRLGR